MSWYTRKLICSSIGLLLTVPVKTEAAKEEVKNVRFRQEGLDIRISYDLIGEGSYTVTLQVSADVGNTFSINPQSVSGDVGPEVHPGQGKQIVWEVLRDVKELKGNGFVFKVRAVRQKKNRLGLWVASAGIGSAGAAAGVLIWRKAEEGKKGKIVIDVPDPENLNR